MSIHVRLNRNTVSFQAIELTLRFDSQESAAAFYDLFNNSAISDVFRASSGEAAYSSNDTPGNIRAAMRDAGFKSPNCENIYAGIAKRGPGTE